MMTEQEHALIVGMFTAQAVLLKSVITALQMKGVLTADDLSAFTVAAAAEEQFDPAMTRVIADLYSSIGKRAGLDLTFLIAKGTDLKLE